MRWNGLNLILRILGMYQLIRMAMEESIRILDSRVSRTLVEYIVLFLQFIYV
jgi:hypothetical protein